MTTDEIRRRVHAIVVEHLGVSTDRVTDDVQLMADPVLTNLDADSLDMIELIMAYEEAFAIEIPDDEAETILTPGDAVRAIAAKLKIEEVA